MNRLRSDNQYCSGCRRYRIFKCFESKQSKKCNDCIKEDARQEKMFPKDRNARMRILGARLNKEFGS